MQAQHYRRWWYHKPPGWDLGKIVAVIIAVIAAIGLCINLARSAEPIVISKQHRSHNRSDHGICWWNCAEMIGKHSGIAPLHDITKRVVESGIGYQSGATEESIQHWMKELNLTLHTNPHGKSDAGVRWMEDHLRHGQPVIASMSTGGDSHAILIKGWTERKQDWTDGAGRKVNDYVVYYIDPNDAARDYQHTWTWFWRDWSGRASVFATEQVARPPVLQPLEKIDMPRTEPGVPPKVIDPHLQKRILVQELPPYAPHDVPYEANHPMQYGPIYIPSNQDIKDGVQRPDDQLRYGKFYYYSSEYQQELLKRHQARQTNK